MKKLFVFVVILGALGYGGFHFYKKWQQQQASARLRQQPKTADVQSRDIRFAIAAAGDIGPADQVSVRPEVNGRIAELPVDLGDSVKKGDLLCRLDDEDLQIERSSRLTEIEGAKLQLEKARRTFERSKQLFTDNLVSKEVFEDARTEFELAANQLEKADKALRLLEDRISKTKIMAPFDCTVLTRPVSIGQALSGSGGFNSGTEVMTIANLNDMIITAHISQADVTRLQTNQVVEIEVDSVPGLRMKGIIQRIAPQAIVKNNLKGFSARIGITDIDSRVRPGMTANLSIPVEAAEGVIAVPLGAVFTEKGQRYVYVKNGGDFERRNIQLGISDYNFAEVTSGLSPGDVVALEQPNEGAESGDRGGGGRRPSPSSGTAAIGATNTSSASGASRSSSTSSGAARPRHPTL
jgi:RND family efflux transporter MFP subunit